MKNNMYSIIIMPKGKHYTTVTLRRQRTRPLAQYLLGSKTVDRQYLPNREAPAMVGDINEILSNPYRNSKGNKYALPPQTPQLILTINKWRFACGLQFIHTTHYPMNVTVIDTRFDYTGVPLLKAMTLEIKKWLIQITWNIKLSRAIRRANRSYNRYQDRFFVLVDNKGNPYVINNKGVKQFKRRGIMNKHVGFTDLLKESIYATPHYRLNTYLTRKNRLIIK